MAGARAGGDIASTAIGTQFPDAHIEAVYIQPAQAGAIADGSGNALASAYQLLNTLPLDVVPPPGPLPAGSPVLPFSSNPLFVGRDGELRSLAAALKGGEGAVVAQVPTAAASGLGGIGKTQLAVEFAHRYGHYFAGGVFWLSFGDPNSVAAQVATHRASPLLGLESRASPPTVDDQAQQVLAAWHAALPRLLIFDNCESPDLVVRWRPTSGGSRILITSRHGGWSPALGMRELPLNVLSPEESVDLLAKFRADADAGTLSQIANELGRLPLALHLAGSYLFVNRLTVAAEQYLAQLRDPALLEHPSLQGGGLSPTGHEHHVARTFALSYERLNPAEPIDALARDLLLGAASLAPGEPIPVSLLARSVDGSGEEASATVQAGAALVRLRDLGLVEAAGGETVRLHRLLAAFLQPLDANGRSRTRIEDELVRVARAVNDSHRPLELLPLQTHLRKVVDSATRDEKEHAASFCSVLAYHLGQAGDLPGARTYHEQALALDRKLLGDEHPSTATSLNNLAAVLSAQGDLPGARTYHEQALALQRKLLGDEHPDTATSLSNLATVLRAQGDLPGARTYLEQALALQRKLLGDEHPATRQTERSLRLLETRSARSSPGTVPQRLLAAIRSLLRRTAAAARSPFR